MLAFTLLGCGYTRVASSQAATVFPRFRIFDAQHDCEALSRGAELCTLGSQSVCFTMPSATVDKVKYDFGIEPRTERLPLANGGSWVFFSATFSAYGSGSLERIAVLRYEPSSKGGSIVNLMPYVAVTNVSDRAMWTVPEVSPYPLFVDADYVWAEGEVHFGKHFFDVGVWRFEPDKQVYVRILQYRTTKRYDGGDDVDRVRVLKPEREEILRRLQCPER